MFSVHVSEADEHEGGTTALKKKHSLASIKPVSAEKHASSFHNFVSHWLFFARLNYFSSKFCFGISAVNLLYGKWHFFLDYYLPLWHKMWF